MKYKVKIKESNSPVKFNQGDIVVHHRNDGDLRVIVTCIDVNNNGNFSGAVVGTDTPRYNLGWYCDNWATYNFKLHKPAVNIKVEVGDYIQSFINGIVVLVTDLLDGDLFKGTVVYSKSIVDVGLNTEWLLSDFHHFDGEIVIGAVSADEGILDDHYDDSEVECAVGDVSDVEIDFDGVEQLLLPPLKNIL